MNIIALIAAVFCFVLLLIIVMVTNKIQSKWKRYAAAFVAVVIAFSLMGLLSNNVLGGSNADISQAGTYLAYLVVASIVIKALFFKKK